MSLRMDAKLLRSHMEKFRSEFIHFSFFGLGVCSSREEYQPLRAMIDHLAYDSQGMALFMIPAEWSDYSKIDLVGPFPAAARLAELDRWPGIAFWTTSRDGGICPIG